MYEDWLLYTKKNKWVKGVQREKCSYLKWEEFDLDQKQKCLKNSSCDVSYRKRVVVEKVLQFSQHEETSNTIQQYADLKTTHKLKESV